MADFDSQPKSIQSIYGWYSEQKLLINRRYQRKLVWTLEEKQKLIESLLKKYPIPAILLAEREHGTYEVIDGLQRLHTIVSFIETAFATKGGEYFDVAQFVTAKNRASSEIFSITAGKVLSASEVGAFLDYSTAIYVMRGASDDEIDDVFSRINTYGHRLSEQERRQAGVQDEFSTLVRLLSCDIRGDASNDILTLEKMPSISIDLPKTKHGYEVEADQVFWVEHGILRSTDLRDSMDEQCIADICGSIVGGQLLERSKDALDQIYETASPENQRIITALDSYGAERCSAEVKLCLDEIRSVCADGSSSKLRNILFSKRTTNPFPALFAVLAIAFHELLIGENKKIADYASIKTALSALDKRIDTSRGSTSPEQRRKNINTIKGLIGPYFVESEARELYDDHTVTDIDAIIRRSEIEAPHYELKQGILRLEGSRKIDSDTLEAVIRTISAIANNGKGRAGTVLIGVADREAHADRVRDLDGIEPRKVGRRYVVGIRREATILKELPENYVARWKNAIRSSSLPQALKDGVLSSLAYSDYYGLGVIVIRVPPQREPSTIGGKLYIREVDETVEVTELTRIMEVTKRFN
ncbi:DUF262 domain-containing protein [Sphaerisporangium rubeum]|uniref:GmrSD restriction endonucleases N-terminal domain-containing protein n=1 Tax=Sphaerisporangium rubeum TaxID=321317 RepID=A0A7X0IJQ2_9ACTN|nr:DUF262 domain-containing protein [Sphaerisporangium rubeum]MBB6476467.1 hypothetical protein [Sphaerisporangium rubeum]